jgi:hypothetical protein
MPSLIRSITEVGSFGEITIALTCLVIRSSIILTCNAASNCAGACHSKVTPSDAASSSAPMRVSSKNGWTPFGTIATVIGEPSVTIWTVERSPESNGSAQAAACGVASCASATRRFEPTAATATPAAAPETNLRRLSEDPLILPHLFIDVLLL